jgi:hypothetical protein
VSHNVEVPPEWRGPDVTEGVAGRWVDRSGRPAISLLLTEPAAADLLTLLRIVAEQTKDGRLTLSSGEDRTHRAVLAVLAARLSHERAD